MRRSRFSDFFYIELTDKDIDKIHLKLNEKEGQTFFTKYKSLHRNIVVYNVIGLLKLSKTIKKKIKSSAIEYMCVDESIELLKLYADDFSSDNLKGTNYKKLLDSF